MKNRTRCTCKNRRARAGDSGEVSSEKSNLLEENLIGDHTIIVPPSLPPNEMRMRGHSLESK